MSVQVKTEELGAVHVASVHLKLMSKEAIKADQDIIKSNLTKLDMAIHSNAVQCLLHAEKHGDTSLMRRLLIEIIEPKGNGYRRQGLIQWMRAYSPMELKGDVITLSGVNEKGQKRPFEVETANEKPFWTDRRFAEVVKPVYRDNLMSKINSSIKEFRSAIANTVNGKPIDPTKPYFDGVHPAELISFFDEVEKRANALPADQTRAVRKAQEDLKQALGDDQEARKAVLEAVQAA